MASRSTFVDTLLPLALTPLVGCGRIAFDGLATTSEDATASADAALPLCFDDNFDDGDVTNWNLNGQWNALADGGGFVLRNNVDMPDGATSPALIGVTAAEVSFDLRMEAATDGDFHLYFMEPGWTNATNDSKYRIALFPAGSDNTDDNVRRVVAPTNTTLAMTPTVLTTGTWHRIAVTFASDHAISVTIAGSAHLSSPADSMLAGPFDIVFDGYRPYAIDNINIGCTR